MEDLLISTLQVFNYPVFRQGSLSESEEYPNHFFTFWNNSTEAESFYDNSEAKTVWNYDLNFYSVDPAQTYTKLLEAKKLLKEVGFIITGKGYDVASDESTHTGRGINVLYLEI